VLSEIPYSNTAQYNRRNICLPSTRINILDEIKERMNLADNKNILLLYGMAGTGKSTIANTIALYFDKQRELGGSFCFKRQDEGRSAKYMFSTIARTMADHNEEYKLKLYEAVKSNISLRTSGQEFPSCLPQPVEREFQCHLWSSTRSSFVNRSRDFG
jgi:hypothetical protein